MRQRQLPGAGTVLLTSMEQEPVGGDLFVSEIREVQVAGQRTSVRLARHLAEMMSAPGVVRVVVSAAPGHED